MGCAIADQTMLVPGGVIKRTQNFCVHQDPLIPIPGFLVIASLRHIRSISEMLESEYKEFSRIIKSTHQAIKSSINVGFLTGIQEESSRHFHLWFFPWTQVIIDRYGQPSLSKIREIMAYYRKEHISKAEWIELERSIEKIKKLML
jgi:diadenosine tetraphosphate (Ap4A) HIT family hydrolase